MKKSKFFSLCIVFNLLFATNTNLNAEPPIVEMISSAIENKNTIYAISFLIAGIYSQLGALITEKRENLSEKFIPTYHQQTAFLTTQIETFNATQPACGPRLVCSINWPQFYDDASPTREIAKKLKALYKCETFCNSVTFMALMAALYTWFFAICIDPKDLKITR